MYAAKASPSEAEEISFEEWQELEDEDDEFTIPNAIAIDDGDYTLDYLYDYYKSKILEDVASASNAMEDEEGVLDSAQYDSDGALIGETYPFSGAVPLSVDTEQDYVNCVRYDGYINGDACTLLFPTGTESLLYIDGGGCLWNMSTSTVQGVVLYDGFAPTSHDGYLLYLTPCLGNNFSTNYSYGSPNYVRHYYDSSGRITYDTEYVLAYVETAPWTFRVADMEMYILLLLGGAILICLLKKSLR